MKTLLFFLVTATAFAATSEWKPIAETASCPMKVQILGKAGEKYVIAIFNGTETKLYTKDNTLFTPKALKSQEFASETDKEQKLGTPTFEFTQQGEVEANPPKLKITLSGRQERCSMNVL
jgi:hypothetical protein